MKTIVGLLKRTFNILIQEHWLHVIDKEIKRFEKYKMKANASAIAVHDLMNRYNEIYKGEEINEF